MPIQLDIEIQYFQNFFIGYFLFNFEIPLRRASDLLDGYFNLTEIAPWGYRQGVSYFLALDKQKREAEAYDQALKDLERREDQLYDDLQSCILDQEGYKRHLSRVREERKRLTGQLHQHQRHELDTYLQRANIALEPALRPSNCAI